MHNKIEITIIKARFENFKLWRNKTKDLIRSAKKDFFENAIKENRDSSFLWKHVKDVTGQSNANRIPSVLHSEEGLLLNPPPPPPGNYQWNESILYKS